MRRWRKWRALSPADRRLLLRAAALLVFARIRLPSMAFRAESERADSAPPGIFSEAALARAQAVARLVGIAAAHSPIRVACLHRSLALWWLLRRETIPCALRLGACRGPGPFAAHAWVECGGVALSDDAERVAQYAPFARAVVPVGAEHPGRPACAP